MLMAAITPDGYGLCTDTRVFSVDGNNTWTLPPAQKVSTPFPHVAVATYGTGHEVHAKIQKTMSWWSLSREPSTSEVAERLAELFRDQADMGLMILGAEGLAYHVPCAALGMARTPHDLFSSARIKRGQMWQLDPSWAPLMDDSLFSAREPASIHEVKRLFQDLAREIDGRDRAVVRLSAVGPPFELVWFAHGAEAVVQRWAESHS